MIINPFGRHVNVRHWPWPLAFRIVEHAAELGTDVGKIVTPSDQIWLLTPFKNPSTLIGGL